MKNLRALQILDLAGSTARPRLAVFCRRVIVIATNVLRSSCDTGFGVLGSPQAPGNKFDGPTALNMVGALCESRIDLDILRI